MGMFLHAEGARRLDREALDKLELSFATILKILRQTSRAPWTIAIGTTIIGLSKGWGKTYRYLLFPAIGG